MSSLSCHLYGRLVADKRPIRLLRSVTLVTYVVQSLNVIKMGWYSVGQFASDIGTVNRDHLGSELAYSYSTWNRWMLALYCGSSG